MGDPVNHPSHYQLPCGVEVYDITKHLSFTVGNIIKYVLRAPQKGKELEDLKKARWYLDQEIARVERVQTASERISGDTLE